MSLGVASERRFSIEAKTQIAAVARGVAMLAMGLFATALFFRNELRNGFTTLMTDRYDGDIEISLLEHWYNVFRGYEAWHTPIFFAPTRRTLGYNDGYFLYGVIHSVFRAAGLDPFISTDLVAWVMRLAGFAGFFLFARRAFAYGYWVSILGAMVFTLSNNAFIESGHAQLLTVGLAPWLALLCFYAMQAAAQRRDRAFLVLGIGIGALLAAWLMTAYYMAWFSLFFAAILGAIALIRHWRDLPGLLRRVRELAAPLAISAAAFAVFSIPFLYIYLPAMRETRATHVYAWMPSALDIINVSNGNILFGGMLQRVYAVIRPGFDNSRILESTTGFPPVLLLCFVLSAFSLWRRRLLTTSFAGLLVIAIGAAWAVHLRADLPGHEFDTPWRLVNRYFPGAVAIRSVGRLEILLAFPVILIALRTVADVGRHAPLLFIPVFVLLVAEELNDNGPGGNDRIGELKRLAGIPQPPPGCRVFFAATAREGAAVKNKLYSHNVDAMFIAEMRHLPTINGVASYMPRGWNLSDATSPSYAARVAGYGAAHQLDGLCGLDLEKQAWLPDIRSWSVGRGGAE
jgi:hypothetical protein